MKIEYGVCLKPKNPSLFEEKLDIRYFVADVCERDNGVIWIELWPYWDEQKKKDFEDFLLKKLNEIVPVGEGYYYYVGIGEMDEVYLTLDEVVKRFEVTNPKECSCLRS